MHRMERILAAACAALLAPSAAMATAVDVDVSLAARALVRDNFYFQPDNQLSSSGAIVAPAFRVSRTGSLFETTLDARTEAGIFSVSQEDNYLDFGGGAQLAARLGLHSLTFSSRFRRDHDPFGEVRTEGSAGETRELDVWEEGRLSLGWRRNGQVKGSLFSELDLTLVNREYVSNEEFTRFLDREGLTLAALLGVNLSEKTGVFLSGFHTEVTFDVEEGELERSGEVQAALLGVRWLATARTSGELRFGGVQRTSDESNQKNSSSYWQATLKLQPTFADTFEVETARSYDASFLSNAAFFDTTLYRLSWAHSWTRRLSTRLDGSLRERDFIGSNVSDELVSAGFDINFDLDRDFTIYANTRLLSRDSSQESREFESSQITLGFSLQLN